MDYHSKSITNFRNIFYFLVVSLTSLILHSVTVFHIIVQIKRSCYFM